MKRWGSVLFIVLLLVPVMAGSAPQSATAPLPEQQTILSADGSESSQSLTSFSETLENDKWYYPDPLANQSAAGAGYYSGSTSGTHADTHTDDTSYFSRTGIAGLGGVSVNVTGIPYQTTDWDLHVTAVIRGYRTAGAAGTGTVGLYTADGSGLDVDTIKTWAGTTDTGYVSVDETLTVSAGAFLAGTIEILLLVGASPSDTWRIDFDYLHVEVVSGDGYTESFNDLTDWVEYGIEQPDGDSWTTDGDVLSIEGNNKGSDNDYDGVSYNISTFVSDSVYVELRYRLNHTSIDKACVFLWNTERAGGSSQTLDLTKSTSWTTHKALVTPYDAKYLMITVKTDIGQNPVKMDVDYLRISKSTEMGFSHDGSTTAGVSLAPLIYEEDMSDVSEWAGYNWESGESITTDGDVATFAYEGDAENDWDGGIVEGLSLASIPVLEIRYKLSSLDADVFQIYLCWSGGDAAHTLPESTTWRTEIIEVDDWTIPLEYPITKILIYGRCDDTIDVDIEIDHIYVGREAQFDDTGTYTSDGDELTLTADADGSIFQIDVDTTATQAMLDTDYYPMLALDFNDTDNADYVMVESYDGTAWATVIANTTIGTDTLRANIKAVDDDVEAFWLSVAPSAVVRLDWGKAYSIANLTYTGSGVGVDDYLYVDSGVLYSHIDDGYIELNHDPALSVSDTYSVWNLTAGSTAPEFSQYVSEWSTYSDETRGATTSGTVTDIKLKFDSIETISAIKFIEDGTAPAVVRSSSTPNDPEDDESTTLSAVITDTVEVYSVAFNAIVYPTGFSDVDYSANEQADNLWNYTFSSLDAGYYCFKIIASDGANTNALTEYAYIEITVREAAIRVEEITLIGAGSDFTMMTFSARINRDCSFTIYEESASSPESDTHTGSVTAPSFNLAWTKLDVDDANVNFTIRFTSGSLTYNYTSQYQVAQTTFYVSTVTQMVSLDTVTVTGRITKLGAYQVYDGSDVLKDYGSITDLDFKVQFTRWGGYDEQNHDFAIKFTNGSQTCWYNSSFYAFKKPVVAPFQTTDLNVLYAFQASFWTLIAVVAVGGMVAVDFYRKEVK